MKRWDKVLVEVQALNLAEMILNQGKVEVTQITLIMEGNKVQNGK